MGFFVGVVGVTRLAAAGGQYREIVVDVQASVTGPLYQCDEMDLAVVNVLYSTAVNVLYSLTAANMHSVGVIVGDDLT